MSQVNWGMTVFGFEYLYDSSHRPGKRRETKSLGAEHTLFGKQPRGSPNNTVIETLFVAVFCSKCAASFPTSTNKKFVGICARDFPD
ncbi:unnamed protein product [Caenorhabditis auriculariae]|uniref:Uncharacterized protein n=1 Tax=Caenorhabditis auriculariae TaxID=2777116 RepID=A0A8S1HMT2_9PELO|nr:unnamed protein product [Caenorhabditis auriculariae]